MRPDSPTVAIATPYQEGSILAIARAAARHGVLDEVLLALRPLGPGAKLPGRLRRLAAARPLEALPPDRLVGLTPVSELGRAASAHMFPGTWGGRAMYWQKHIFDRRASRRIRADVVVGMPGSSAETFRRTKQRAGRTVLNFVNSHPVYHNDYLRQLAGVSNRELIPSWVAARVDEELELADLVLVPSRFVARQLESLAIGTKIVVEPYGVDLGKFRGPDDHSPSTDRVLCLYVGQISHRKGVRFLIEAASLIRSPRLEVALVGPMVSREVLGDIGENRNISYRGNAGHDQVAELMRAADVFVLPSVEDAYPLAVLEAMASSLPVIVTSNVGSAELIDHGANGFVVPPADPSSLAFYLKLLCDDESLRQRMGTAARQRVETQHSWDQYGERVVARLETDGALDEHRP